MSNCDFSTRILKGCKDLTGGISKLYISNFQNYSLSNFNINGKFLIEMPATIIYDYNLDGVSYTETVALDKGAISYNQSITFNVPEVSANREIFKFPLKKTRAILVDRNGKIRIFGLLNGLKGTYNTLSGVEKSDFNGYQVTLTGFEEMEALFIDDLIATGLIPSQQKNYLFQDGDNFIYNDGIVNYIFN